MQLALNTGVVAVPVAEAVRDRPDVRAAIVARNGLRRRLMLAFIGLSSLVVIAAIIAMLSLWINRASDDRTSRRSIPIATTSLDLTRTAQRIVDAAPRLAGAKTVATQTRTRDDLESEVTKLDTLLAKLRQYDIDPKAGAAIERAVSQFSANISAIDRVVTARIAIQSSSAKQIATGEAAVRSILGTLQPLMDFQGVGSRLLLGSDPEVAARRSRLIRAESAAREIGLLLGVFGNVDGADANTRADRAVGVIEAVLPDLAPSRHASVQGDLQTLKAIFTGQDSLGRQHAFELQMVGAAQQALKENADLASRFAEAVDRMVNVAKADVAAANARAIRVQHTAFWLLSTVVAATLVASFLIVRYYVQRNILARLTALTSSMMAIANGDLGAEIPDGSDDELGSMAMALQVFRDTAVEVRDSNLREIQETRNRLHHAIENIQEGFALFDAQDALTLCNTQFGRLLFGPSGRAGIGARYADLLQRLVDGGVLALQGETAAEWVRAALRTHRTPVGTEVWPLRDDRWVRATERRTDDGGTVMVITDITAIKRHEQELGQLVEKLRKASAAKSSFIANVSHELRTPLTAVLGFAQIVQNRLENVLLPRIENPDRLTERAMAQVRENVGIMILEGQRLTKMINDILDLEKIEAGQMVWDIEPVDVGSVIRQAAAATASLYRNKRLEFHADVDGDLPPVSGDRDRLVQVVINLIANAVKFTDRGHIACSAKRGAGPFISVSVSDTGIGIAPQDQIDVFEKFRQVGDTLTEKPSGTGLGLPICREIVEHLGGAITVESIPGFGSTFTFQLPTAEAGAAPIRTKRKSDDQEDRDS